MSIAEQEDLLDDICNDVLGYGPLEPLLARDEIADIMVNGSGTVYIEAAARFRRPASAFATISSYSISVSASSVRSAGEAWAAEGARVGYLPQEPELDTAKSVRENVMEAVAAQKAILDRYNELALNYSDETADEMTKLQDEIESKGLWDGRVRIAISM